MSPADDRATPGVCQAHTCSPSRRLDGASGQPPACRHQDANPTLERPARRWLAILPPGTRVTSAAWLDTQVTSRQRRLDRALDITADGARRLEHTEWQLRWSSKLPFRMHEYHNLMVTALVSELAAKKRRAKPHLQPAKEEAPPRNAAEVALPVPVRSTVVLLSGREKPWPAEGSYRTSPVGAPFCGVTFRIDAVYQRTVPELEARDSPLWLVFAPLAVDADETSMARVVARLRERATGRAFEELAVAMVVMADVDGRRRGLRSGIIRLLNEETVMQNWIYKQGEEKGIETSAARSLQALFVRRAGRQPTPQEAQAVARRARDVTPERLVEIIEMPTEDFLAWLATP